MKKAKQAHVGRGKGGSFGGDAHVSHTSMGMGDFYGTGIRNKMGRVREEMGVPRATKKQVKTPPKSLA